MELELLVIRKCELMMKNKQYQRVVDYLESRFHKLKN